MNAYDREVLETQLCTLGVQWESHGRRTLLAHLLGTADVLAAWGNPVSVCVAGAFHSVYGTRAYQMPLTRAPDRAVVRKLIGFYSEEIVHSYASFSMPEVVVAVEETAPQGLDGRFESQLGRTLADTVLELHAANLFEQLEDLMTEFQPSHIESQVALLIRGRHALSAGAQLAIESARSAFISLSETRLNKPGKGG